MNAVKAITDALNATNVDEQEGYTATEWTEAAENLPDDVVLGMPWCVFDLEKDEMGSVVMQEPFDQFSNPRDEVGPKRRLRYDVLAILAWIPAKRENPDLTIQDVSDRINEDNVNDILDSVFVFWGIDLPALRKLREEREAAEAGEEKPEKVESEDLDP
jgi:hypothetical protein